ncbi:hypothetical protein HD806DRAFT_268585 [Xylariaceae sp. AK1471]|nr:hypothetical protein HD806DRAFT_268585 [Xylariaceae sp. AK1471]
MVRTKEKPRQSRESQVKQAKLQAEQSTLLATQLGYPTPTGYTFTDEMWRTKTVKPLRCFSQEHDHGPLRPSWPAPFAGSMPPRTISQRAHEEDLALWASSSSIEVYEERKRARDEQRRSEREAFIRDQPVFHKFSSLPAELRLLVWKMALEEPTRVALTVSEYRSPPRQPGVWCATVFRYPSAYAATAVLPPLMLVNYESHKLASRHYRRAFQGVDGEGGVLAAYPTVLTVKGVAFTLMRPDSLSLVQDFILEYEWYPRVAAKMDDQYRAVLLVPALKTFVVIARGQNGPSISWDLRRLFLELMEVDPYLNVPTIEIRIGDCSDDEAEWACHFRGSPLELPEA